MKLILKLTPVVVLIGSVLHLSCKKETSCEICKETNQPPIAVAGPDQVITLPADSVLLDGKQSSDPDGIISSYLWTKISGPASFNISKASDSITKLRNLAAGTYQSIPNVWIMRIPVDSTWVGKESNAKIKLL